MWAGPRPRSAVLFGAVFGIVLLAAGCSGDDAAETASTTVPTLPPVTAGPVALTELVPGDCLTGFPIGVSERIRIDSAQVVTCRGGHDLEVFAVFSLAGEEFPNTDADAYPGQQRIVDAADQGCKRRLEDLGEASARYGVVVVWPTSQSWAVGDREVVCAAYLANGSSFDGPTLIAG